MNTDKTYIKISPDFDYLFIDGNGCCSTAYGDEISNEDFSLGPRFRIVIPGIEEWHRRYVYSTDFAATKTDESFDWLSWHYEGLLFAKEIKRQLPTCFKLLYTAPYEDVSGLIPEEIEIDDSIDKLICSLEIEANVHSKLGLKNIVVFSSTCKLDGIELSMCVGKLKSECHIPLYRIDGLKNWLHDIIKGEKDVLLESSLYCDVRNMPGCWRRKWTIAWLTQHRKSSLSAISTMLTRKSFPSTVSITRR